MNSRSHDSITELTPRYAVGSKVSDIAVRRTTLAKASLLGFFKREKKSLLDLPPLENFSEKEEQFVRSVLLSISPDGRLFTGINRIRFVNGTANGHVGASFGYSRNKEGKVVERDIAIYGPIGSEPLSRNELVRKLVHEVTHHAFDPSSHWEPDSNGQPILSASGVALFGTPENAHKAEMIMHRLAQQALALESYVNDYQRSFADAYRANIAFINVRITTAVQAREDANALKALITATSSKEDIDRAEEANKAATLAEQTIANLQNEASRAYHLLTLEGLTSLMEKVFLNPQNLIQKNEADKKRWVNGGHNTEHAGVGIADVPYMDTLEAAEAILMMVYKVDKHGLNAIRAGIKKNITPISTSKKGAID